MRLLVFALIATLFLSGCVGEAPSENVTQPPKDDVYPPPEPPKQNVTENVTDSCRWSAPAQEPKPKTLSYRSGYSVDALAISRYGYRAVAGGQDWKIYYFKQGEEKPAFTYETGDQVNTVAMSDDGRTFVAGSYDNSIYVFDCDKSTPLWSYDTSEDDPASSTVEGVDISANGKWIAAVTKTHAYLFERMNSTPLLKLNLSDKASRLATVKMSDDGYRMFVGTIPDGKEGKVFLIAAQGRLKGLLWEYSIPDLGQVGGVQIPVDISSEGDYAAAGGSDNRVYFWDASSSSPLWTYLIANESRVYSVSLSDDGSKLAATGDFKLFYFQDTEHATQNTILPSWVNDGTFYDPGNESRSDYWYIGNYLDGVDVSSDGGSVAVGAYLYGHFFSFTDGSNESMEMYDLYNGGDSVGAVDISSDGSWIIVGSTFEGDVLRVYIG
jgi:WD40 repeat protein